MKYAPTNLGSGNSDGFGIFERGKKLFELTNHLGNVLATVSDEKTGVDADNNGTIDYYTADVVSAQDYYPFGMGMPGRKFSSEKYRYGFNGKENDNDITEGTQDYGMRMSDNRLGRFLSVDPLTASYPWYTPYQFAGNKPIWATDLDGLEEKPTNNGTGEGEVQPTSGKVQSTKGPFKEIITKSWFWHKGSQEYGTKADWYGEEEYKRLVWPISADLAGYTDMYKTPGIGKNWSDDEKANVANTKLGQFISSGLSEKEVKGLLSQAYNVSMTQAANSSGRAEFAPVNVEDLLIVGQIVKLGLKALVKGAAMGEKKAIVIGEGMYRVKPAARSIGAKWYQAWSKNFPSGRLMTEAELNAAKVRNARWLKSKINQGYKIYDIGPRGINITSPFYQLERDIIQKTGYPTTPLIGF